MNRKKDFRKQKLSQSPSCLFELVQKLVLHPSQQYILYLFHSLCLVSLFSSFTPSLWAWSTFVIVRYWYGSFLVMHPCKKVQADTHQKCLSVFSSFESTGNLDWCLFKFLVKSVWSVLSWVCWNEMGVDELVWYAADALLILYHILLNTKNDHLNNSVSVGVA